MSFSFRLIGLSYYRLDWLVLFIVFLYCTDMLHISALSAYFQVIESKFSIWNITRWSSKQWECCQAAESGSRNQSSSVWIFVYSTLQCYLYRSIYVCRAAIGQWFLSQIHSKIVGVTLLLEPTTFLTRSWRSEGYLPIDGFGSSLLFAPIYALRLFVILLKLPQKCATERRHLILLMV